MIASAPVGHWSAELEALLRRYLSATPVPATDHAALLTGVALALTSHASATADEALGILIQGVGDWLQAHHRLPQAMPPVHRGPMLSPSLEPLPLKTLWQTRHGSPHPDAARRSDAERKNMP